jgi:hypothetical protein
MPNPRLCKPLLDRITDRAHIIEIGTESYRFRRTFEKRKGQSPGTSHEREFAEDKTSSQRRRRVRSSIGQHPSEENRKREGTSEVNERRDMVDPHLPEGSSPTVAGPNCQTYSYRPAARSRSICDISTWRGIPISA